MKSKQYCSVCKEWLDMEVVSSGDPEDDDGVTWYRCPGCQGFLPKLNAGADADAPATGGEAGNDHPEEPAEPDAADDAASPAGEVSDLPWDSPQDMLEEAEATSTAEVSATMAELEAGSDTEDDAESDDSAESAASEPLAEYAAMLAEVDPGAASPYRPWETYEVGQCIIHLAWDDCGVVVGKEALPGGRQVIKAYFADAGVVRLIENAPR